MLREAGLRPVDSPHLYFVLSVMRVLLIKQEDSSAWVKVERMMDNWEMFSRDLKLVKGMSKVAEFLRSEAKLAWVEAIGRRKEILGNKENGNARRKHPLTQISEIRSY